MSGLDPSQITVDTHASASPDHSVQPALDPLRPDVHTECEHQVCNWSPDANRLLFLGQNGRFTIATEQFRNVRSRLWQIRQRHPFSTVLVSSARAREGRTFVAANLAHALAQQQGKRVLLIDGDLRNPDLHTYLGALREPGLSDYLAGTTDHLQIVQSGSIRDLCFIPSGAPTQNAAELLSSGRLKLLLKQFGHFDWMIIDSPPSTSVCDATIFSDICDGVLLVVEAAKTSMEVAERMQREFTDKLILGVILNRLNGRAMHKAAKATA